MNYLTVTKKPGFVSLLILIAFLTILAGCPQMQAPAHDKTTEQNSSSDEHSHSWIITEDTAPTFFTEGRRIFTCTECGQTSVFNIPPLYSVPSDANGKSLSSVNQGDTVYFGFFPQTVAPESLTIDKTTALHIPMGSMICYKAENGNFYVEAAGYQDNNGTRYSDNTKVGKDGNTKRWFLVEPIKWTVASTNYNNASLLVADSILTGNIPFAATTATTTSATTAITYDNSHLRAYLNGSASSRYAGKGFLQSAFIPQAQLSLAGTGDKIIQLNATQITSTTTYRFTRSKKATDFAKANHVSTGNGNGNVNSSGKWWTRSIYQTSQGQRPSPELFSVVPETFPNPSNLPKRADSTDIGIVPAIIINLSGSSAIGTISFVINTN